MTMRAEKESAAQRTPGGRCGTCRCASFKGVDVSSKKHLFPTTQRFFSAAAGAATSDQRMHMAASQLGGRLPRQIQRALPVYVACLVLIIFLSNTSLFGSSLSVVKRDWTAHGVGAGSAQFPRKIWQTWKVDPLGFEQRDLSVAKTWTAKNPGHRYEVLTDGNDLYYVESHFGPAGLNRPDIVDTYRALSAKIVKADLLRYLVMYVEGGLYADIDVEALRPIEKFIPDRYDEKDIDMIIGVEIDQPDLADHPILGQKSKSFCQWTFMCKPGLPVMLRLVDHIIKWLNDVAKRQQKPISEIELDFDEVISGTGPSAFTGAILAEMSARSGHTVTWDSFHGMAESKIVGGVLVLTVEAFAAGQGHSDSGNHNTRTALVKHHYHASGWPTNHPRFRHPVYGEVEKCNWEVECIKLWDVNIKAFETLPPAEQAKLIAIREVADIQAAQAAELQAKQLEEFEAARQFAEVQAKQIAEYEAAKQKAELEAAKQAELEAPKPIELEAAKPAEPDAAQPALL